MGIMTHAKFHFNRLILTLVFGIRASEPPRAWRTTKKAGHDRVNIDFSQEIFAIDMLSEGFKIIFEASPQACSATYTTIWRPGFKTISERNTSDRWSSKSNDLNF